MSLFFIVVWTDVLSGLCFQDRRQNSQDACGCVPPQMWQDMTTKRSINGGLDGGSNPTASLLQMLLQRVISEAFYFSFWPWTWIMKIEQAQTTWCDIHNNWGRVNFKLSRRKAFILTDSCFADRVSSCPILGHFTCCNLGLTVRLWQVGLL